MNIVKRFGVFWYHFIVGEDWRIAAGVVFGLSITGFMVHTFQVQAWWLLPILVVSMLTISLWHTTRRR